MNDAAPEGNAHAFSGRHTCIFVGAGSSKALFDVPIQHSLIDRFLSWDAGNSGRPHLSKSLRRLLGTIGDVELVLSHYHNVAYPQDAPRSNRHALELLLLRVALAKYFEDVVRDSRANSAVDSTRLVRTFLSARQLEIDSIFVVSTNYDTGLEATLVEAFGPGAVWYPGVSTRSRDDAIPVLKLHGSINWMEDRGQGSRGFSRPGKPVVIAEPCSLNLKPYSGENGYFFQRDSTKLTPILIPFLFQKSAWLKDDNPHWKQIFDKTWSLAESAMVKSKNLMFWGYGLPAADYHMFSLLHRVLERPGAVFEVVDKGSVQTTMLRLAALFQDRATTFRDGLVSYLEETSGAHAAIRG